MLTTQNIEAELSYAYLHAVAAAAGVACNVTDRHLDNAGVDATLHIVHDVPPLTDLTVHVQLKATAKPVNPIEGRLPYWLADVRRYDKLRLPGSMPPRLLIVLFLPEDAQEWLTASAEELVLRRCAYWVSLRGAEESDNKSGVTVYLPESQALTPSALRDVLERLSRQEELTYAG